MVELWRFNRTWRSTLREYIIISKIVQNVAMDHHVKFQVCISKNDWFRLGRIPDGLILIFRSPNRFFGPKLRAHANIVEHYFCHFSFLWVIPRLLQYEASLSRNLHHPNTYIRNLHFKMVKLSSYGACALCNPLYFYDFFTIFQVIKSF